MKVRKSVYYNYYYSNVSFIPESGNLSSWGAEPTDKSGNYTNQKEGDEEGSRSSEDAQHINCLRLQPLESAEANIDVTGLFPPQLVESIQNDQELYSVFQTFFPDQKYAINSQYEQHNRTVTVERSTREYCKRRYPRHQRSGDKLVPCKKFKSSACVPEKTGDGGERA